LDPQQNLGFGFSLGFGSVVTENRAFGFCFKTDPPSPSCNCSAFAVASITEQEMGVSTPPVIVSLCAKSCCAIKDDRHSVLAPKSSIVNDYICVDSFGFLGTAQ